MGVNPVVPDLRRYAGHSARGAFRDELEPRTGQRSSTLLCPPDPPERNRPSMAGRNWATLNALARPPGSSAPAGPGR